MSTWAVVLAGGVGSRFWPLSTPSRPKQLLPLASEQPLLVDAVDRLLPLVPAEQVLLLTNASLVGPIGAAVPVVPRGNVIAEPRPAGTAAALAWAAHEIVCRDGPDAVMISVHADWAVADAEGYRDALALAVRVAAEHHVLVTVGVVPSRPDPGFGYIQPGDALEEGVRRVSRFVEKPDRHRAGMMVSEGYLWNSGIFVWRAGDFLDDVRKFTPEVAPALHAYSDDRDAFFANATPIAVDNGVLERSDRVVVLPGDFGWDDIGTWGALRRLESEPAANVTHGAVYAVESTDNVVHAETASVVLYGVSDLVVVEREGLVLVTTNERSAELKKLLDALPSAVRERE
jgi:mannose-1-phosphate guanylyltransferase